jgi:hypothetical protein
VCASPVVTNLIRVEVGVDAPPEMSARAVATPRTPTNNARVINNTMFRRNMCEKI